MAYADRVKETSTTTGTGAIALAGAGTGFRTFASGFTVGATMPYAISDALGNWEIGNGTLTGTTTLARTTVLASSNAGALVSFPAGSKDVFCTLSAAQIAAFQVSQDIAFTTAIPLSAAGTQYMPQQTVASVLAFTVAASPVKGASVYVRLIADGTNAPTFTGFTELGGSMGYDNRNGVVNVIQFFFDGITVWFNVMQAFNAATVVVYPRIAAGARSLAESGSGPYIYTGSGSGFGGNTEASGWLDKAFQSGVDGSFIVQALSAPGNNTLEMLIGIDESATPQGYTTVAFGIVNHNGGYQAFTNGTAGSIYAAAVQYDYIRVRRVGSTLYIDLSKDNITYTNITSWAGVSTGVMYGIVLATGTGVQFKLVSMSGLA